MHQNNINMSVLAGVFWRHWEMKRVCGACLMSRDLKEFDERSGLEGERACSEVTTYGPNRLDKLCLDLYVPTAIHL